MSAAAEVKAELRKVADPEKAAFYPRFFKAGPGEYGEGDRFLGVSVPKQRKIARRFRELARDQLQILLADRFHECRLTALLILVEQFRRAGPDARDEIVRVYLDHLERVNNWDLVDSSAPQILGAWLEDRDRSPLYELAQSGHLWRQRIAIVSCLHFIKRGELEDALAISDLLLDHPHDLIHKAVGWMLREVGKQDLGVLEGFLRPRYRRMPRTMLRYAIEKLEERRRRAYLKGEA